MANRPDIIIVMTDEERAVPPPYAHRLPPSGASNGLVRRVLGRFVR